MAKSLKFGTCAKKNFPEGWVNKFFVSRVGTLLFFYWRFWLIQPLLGSNRKESGYVCRRITSCSRLKFDALLFHLLDSCHLLLCTPLVLFYSPTILLFTLQNSWQGLDPQSDPLTTKRVINVSEKFTSSLENWVAGYCSSRKWAKVEKLVLWLADFSQIV